MQALLLLFFFWGRRRWRHFANTVAAAFSGTTLALPKPWESGRRKQQCLAPLWFQLQKQENARSLLFRSRCGRIQAPMGSTPMTS